MSDDNVEDILSHANSDIAAAASSVDIDKLRSVYLGKKSPLTQIMKTLVTKPVSERPILGQKVNQAKKEIESWLRDKAEELNAKAIEDSLNSEAVDVTLPGLKDKAGTLHPLTQMQNELEHFFSLLGFEVVEGPEVEDDYHNFTALNIPEHHPARHMHDTFYLPDGKLLRTHTSPMQIRIMENRKPPLAAIVPGRVYRCDSDATHSPMFHQLEGFMVGEHVTMRNLKWVLKRLVEHFFGVGTKMQMRPSYFPFTEPSVEVDIWWQKQNGEGRWLEIGGAGMIHPNVLQAVNIDSKSYSGFAFGLGIDRFAMLKYGIDDLRIIFENDVRFLRQF